MNTKVGEEIKERKNNSFLPYLSSFSGESGQALSS